MKTLIDVRLLGKSAHAGIPVFTKEIVGRLIDTPGDSFELFYPGMRKRRLPSSWLAKGTVSVIDWKVPNKLLDVSNLLLRRPDMSRHAKTDILFSPHLNNIHKGALPRVLTVHDLSFAHHPAFFSKTQRLWHFLQDWRNQIREADHLIAVSHYTKMDIVKTLGIPEERISVVYPGISDEFHPLDVHDAGLLQFQRKHSIRAPYFLYLGALEARKNITQLVAAFGLLRTDARFKDHELILAGSPGHGADEIVRAIRRLRLGRSVRILSRVADEERKFLYNGAVAFACTSFFEGFGFPPLEAQACGIPVVASDRTSFVETLGDSAPLVDPWKPSELAGALSELATDAQARSLAIAKGHANVKRFNWNDAAGQIHAIIKRTRSAFYE